MQTIDVLGCAVLVIATIAASRDAAAQTRLSPSTLTPIECREVVDTIASQIERIYIDADTAKLIANKLRARLQSGAYSEALDENRLAELVTKDLRSVNGDLHLGVRVSGAAGAAPLGLPPFLLREQHYALGRVDVLPGNIGYLELRGFAVDNEAQSLIVAALEYLKTTDALIIDVRRNRGGSGELSNFLISHFTGADSIASLRVTSRDGGEGFAHAGSGNPVRYTLATVPGPRRPDVPLYVLTSRATASAGEDFTFVLQNLKRATIVGDRTAGAGHNVTMVPSGYGFATSISITRVADPKTGKEWERIGVQPDVRVDPALALDSAQILALRAIEAHAPAQSRARLTFLRETREAIMHPHPVPNERLAAYAGEFDGDRHVRASNGRLLLEVAPPSYADTLVALSDSVFATSSQARLMFVRGARGGVEMRIVGPDGTAMVVQRRSDSTTAVMRAPAPAGTASPSPRRTRMR